MTNYFKKIILLGEVHGTEGNLWGLMHLIKLLEVGNHSAGVALELPTEWNGVLNNLSQNNVDKLYKLISDSEELKSGRISEVHVHTYLKLVEKGIRLYAVRDNHDDWNETDRRMQQNILDISSDIDIVIATLGNLHVGKEVFVAEWDTNYTCHPVGELLASNATSIIMRYSNSEYRNFNNIGKLENHECTNSCKKDKVSLSKELQNRNYDYEMYIHDSPYT